MKKQEVLDIIERLSESISGAKLLSQGRMPDVMETPKYLVEFHPKAFAVQIYVRKGPILATYARINTNLSSKEAFEKLMNIILND